MVNLAKYRGVVAQMYKDRFDVYRHGTETDANGATHQVCYQIPAMSDQPCQISPEQTDDAMPRAQAIQDADQYISIHCRPELDLISGDYIVARKMRNGAAVRTYKGTIGEPKVLPTHIKATFKIDSSEV